MIRYIFYFWNPPILTLEQKVEAGRQIVMSGGPEAWKKKAPYLPDGERARDEAYASTRRTVPQMILAFICSLGFLAIVAVIAGPRLWVPLGVVCVTVLRLCLYTLVTARRRYHTWIDKVVDAYLNDVEKAIGITRLSDEEHLRLAGPAADGRRRPWSTATLGAS